MVTKNTIKILCTGEIEVNWNDLRELQLTSSGEKLKSTDETHINKLAFSISKYGIVNNLQVWIDPKTKAIYCFDAHHRKLAIENLVKNGWIIPPLPATRCLAKTKKEAKKLLLLKESKSSWINTDAIDEYLADVDLDIEIAESLIDIPEIDLSDLFGEKNKKRERVEQNQDPKTIFIIEVHAADEMEQEKIYNDLIEQGYKCKVSIL